MREPALDVVVIGAGAAGLMAAIHAAERGRRVLLLEKNRRAGVKILISGGTRCNLTNARGLRSLSVVSGPIDPLYDPCEAQGARSIQRAFGANGKFLGPALRAFSVEQTVTFFEDLGVATKVEATGKVFPVSGRATDVLCALLRRLDHSGAQLSTSSPVLSVEPVGDRFEVRSPERTVLCSRVIVAAGGKSYSGSGTTGDGYSIARRYGHTIIDPRPALVPIRVASDWVAGLRGVTLPDVRARVLRPDGSVLQERRESLLLAHFGLTGPAILDISRAVTRNDLDEPLDLEIDLLPGLKADALDQKLQKASRSGRPLVAGLLPAAIPRRLADMLLEVSSIPLDRLGPELSREERRKLVQTMKSLRLRISGTLGFAKAEITTGGVALDEVDPGTLESRLHPRLHFIGEVLDLDGLIGGYNFQAAWSTGWLAGESV